MSPWEILEIEPTEEASAIKKAYAKKLKIYHPEDDPKGYQRLREAYDRALKLAKAMQANREEKEASLQTAGTLSETLDTQESSWAGFSRVNDAEQIPDDEDIEVKYPKINIIDENGNYEDEENDYNPHRINIKNERIDTLDESEKYVDDLIAKVQALYEDFFQRIDERNWQELLNSEAMWRLDLRDLVNRRMVAFLSEHRFLPKNIWRLLNSNFQWDSQGKQLSSWCSEDFITNLKTQIGGRRGDFYYYFDWNIKINYEAYLGYREEAKAALRENNLIKAESCINAAYSMYTMDPELLCIRGDYYLKEKDKKRADAWFQAAININPNDVDIRFYIAEIMFENNRYFEAISVCNIIMGWLPNNLEVKCFVARCYIKLGKLSKAKAILIRNAKTDSSDVETRKCLNELVMTYGAKLNKDPHSVSIMRSLKKLFDVLGDKEHKKRVKITLFDLLFKPMKYLLICFVICIVIFISTVLVIATKGKAIALIGALIYLYKNRKSKKGKTPKIKSEKSKSPKRKTKPR